MIMPGITTKIVDVTSNLVWVIFIYHFSIPILYVISINLGHNLKIIYFDKEMSKNDFCEKNKKINIDLKLDV